MSLCLPMTISASAYQVYLQSVNSLGYAHADMSSQASDVSTAYYNPAGMTRLNQGQMEIGVIGYEFKSQYRSKLAANLPPKLQDKVNAFIEKLFSGTIPADFLKVYVPRANNHTFNTIPNLHIVQPIPCAPWDLTLGLSVVSPWALETDYNNSLISSIYADKTCINSLSINPSIAFRPFRQLSVGVGLNVQEVRSYYSSSILVFGLESKLRGWATTWNVGALYELSDCTRFGVTYRPKVTYNQTGNTKLLTEKVNAKSRFVCPGTVTFGVYHQLDCCTSIMATAAYTMWDDVRKINIRSELVPINIQGFLLDFSTQSIPLKWRSSWFLAIGADYRVNDCWVLKAGFAYDRTPTTLKHREIRIPDQDRYHFAFGARYSFSECLMFDFGYQYVYMPTVAIRNSSALPIDIFAANNIPANVVTRGHSQSHATFLGGELIWKW